MTKKYLKKNNQPQQQNISVHETAAEDRRRVLKASVAAGVVLSSTQWAKPIVNAVMLPAHAQTSEVCPDLSVSFSGTSFELNSDGDDMQSSTLQITNTSESRIFPSATTTSSSKGETYSVAFSPDRLEAGETGEITLSVNFTGLSTFCVDNDSAQLLAVSLGLVGSESCALTTIANSPSIRINFGC